MRFKIISHKTAMAQKIKLGVSEISSIVARTLGPGGLPILIEREGLTASGDPLEPLITKDGVTVASECSHPDPEVDVVIQTVKGICRKTNRIAGDGTTTAIVLGQAILDEAQSLLEKNPDLNPQLLRESIEAATKKAIDLLKAQARPVNKPEEVEAVAVISSNGDLDVGRVIRQAFDAVGPQGVITVDEGYSTHTTINIVEGFQVRRGAEGQDRFFNNTDRTKYEAEDACVIIYDNKLNSYTELLPVLNKIAEENKKGIPPIVLVAHDFSQDVIMFLLVQKAELGLKFCAIKAPHVTNVRTSMLDDMAILTGGSRLGNGNKSIQVAEMPDVGYVERVVIDKYTATFYGGGGSEDAVLDRVKQLEASRAQAESPYDASVISDRIASLAQGIAKIGVGGTTDLEIKERYHRIEDALNAARAAVEEGIVAGGGAALYRIAFELGEDGATIGEYVLSRALKAPLLQILENVGKTPEPSIVDSIHSNPNATYDARKKELVDAFEAGIIDPVKVTRTALENACSIASLLSTCGGAIVMNRSKDA